MYKHVYFVILIIFIHLWWSFGMRLNDKFRICSKDVMSELVYKQKNLAFITNYIVTTA